jgi:magnesium transporter
MTKPQEKETEVHIRVIEFGKGVFNEREIDSIEKCLPLKPAPTTTWISIDGTHDRFLIDAIGQTFKMHPLLLGFIIDPNPHSKIQEFGDTLYLEAETGTIKGSTGIQPLKVALLLGSNFVISFEERSSALLDDVRNHLRTQISHIRLLTPDYLVYLIADAIVDSYYELMDKFEERNEKIEEDLLGHPKKAILQEIQKSKRSVATLRRYLWPARDIFKQISKSESALIHEETRPYFQEEWDRVLRAIDLNDNLHESVSGLIDIHLSSSSNRTNDVMKILTIFSTIFLPLTFLASLYGMNFTIIPGLTNPSSFYVVVAIMIVIVAVMLSLFRKIRWI